MGRQYIWWTDGSILKGILTDMIRGKRPKCKSAKKMEIQRQRTIIENDAFLFETCRVKYNQN